MPSDTSPSPTTPDRSADELAERIFDSCLALFDIAAVYLGSALGYYQTLADKGPTTSTELAQHTQTAERYAREWLEQQAVTGILQIAQPANTTTADARRYSLPPGYADALLNRDGPAYATPAAVQTAAAIFQLPAVLDAFRSGGGVPWDAYGAPMRDSQGEINRATFLNDLGQNWLPQIPDIDQRLRSATADEPARVADIGCGLGWSSVGIALAYPDVHVDGFDLDAPAIDQATQLAREYAVDDRVTFHLADAGSVDRDQPYDLAIALECIHDLPDPVAVLRTMRQLTDGRGDSGGAVLIVDERAAETFQAPGDDMERFFYGFSVTTCLPDGLSTQPSVGTGTVMRPDTLRAYALDAGFSSTAILDIEHEQFRIYRLNA